MLIPFEYTKTSYICNGSPELEYNSIFLTLPRQRIIGAADGVNDPKVFELLLGPLLELMIPKVFGSVGGKLCLAQNSVNIQYTIVSYMIYTVDKS
jgi:hypothetical protein